MLWQAECNMMSNHFKGVKTSGTSLEHQKIPMH